MVAMLAHRGPDGFGLYLDDHVALGNTRLGIVGLDDGFQPLHNELRTVWLSANGEIFNHVELRRHLAGKGHRFATGSDCEAIVHAYEEWGDAAFARLEGQFAFALWDARARRLVLVRDRLGILPLHYAVVGGAVVFASEAKALFAGGRIEPRIEPAALGQLFTTWSVVAPDSVFAGVRVVRPGSAVSFGLDASRSERRWWEPTFAPAAADGRRALDEATDELEHRLRRAVVRRLRADVPVGAYLSGGLGLCRRLPVRGRSDRRPARYLRCRLLRRPLRRDRVPGRRGAAARDAPPRRALPGARPRGRARRGRVELRDAAAPERPAPVLPARAQCPRRRLEDGLQRRGRRRAARGLQHLQGGSRPALLGARSRVVASARAPGPAASVRGRARDPADGCVADVLRAGPDRGRRPLLLAPHPLGEQRVGAARALRRRPP